jgi:hypothetical protein
MMHKRPMLTMSLVLGLALSGCGQLLDTPLDSFSASSSPVGDEIRPDSKGDKNNVVADVTNPIRPDSKGDKNNAVDTVNQPIRPDSKGDKNNLATIQGTLRLPLGIAHQLAVLPSSPWQVAAGVIFGAPAYADGHFTEAELQTFSAQVDGVEVSFQVLSVAVEPATGEQLVTYAIAQVSPNVNQHVVISSPSETLVLGTLIPGTQANQTLYLSEEMNLETTAWAMVAQAFQKKQGKGLKDATFEFLRSLRTGPEIASVAKSLKAEFSNPRNQGKKLNELTALTALIEAETEKLIKAKNPQAQQSAPPAQATSNQSENSNGQGSDSNNGQGNGNNNGQSGSNNAQGNGNNNGQSDSNNGQGNGNNNGQGNGNNNGQGNGNNNGQGNGNNNGQGNGNNNCNGQGNGNHNCAD